MNIIQIPADKTTYVSDPVTITDAGYITIHVLGDITRSGRVQIQIQDAQGEWRSYPTLTWYSVAVVNFKVPAGTTLRATFDKCKAAGIEVAFTAQSTGGGGGDIPDAPVDGLVYGRQDSDWVSLADVAVSGDYNDLDNLPVLGTSSGMNVAPVGDAALDQVVKGDDSRLTDARTPTAHTHVMSDITDLAAALATKVDVRAGYDLSQENFTPSEKAKLAGLEGSRWKGTFLTLQALIDGVSDPQPGDYADVDAGAGQEIMRYIWDDSDSVWVAQAGEASPLTPAQVKSMYESNPDTNAFSDAEKDKLAGIAPGATANAGTVTSVQLSVPTGLQVSGSPITESGTLTIGYEAGYSLPENVKQAQWDEAYGWGDHADAGYALAADLGDLASKDSVSVGDIDATGTPAANTYLSGDGSWKTPGDGGDMVYPDPGIAVSTGTAWDTSIVVEGDVADTEGSQTLSNKTLGAGTTEGVTVFNTGTTIDASLTPFIVFEDLTEDIVIGVNLAVGVSRSVWVNPGTHSVTWPAGSVLVNFPDGGLPQNTFSLLTITGRPGADEGVVAYVTGV